jgi:hypothetical protein
MVSRALVVMDPAGIASVDAGGFANSDDKDLALSAKVSAFPLAEEYDNEPLSAVTFPKKMWPRGKPIIVCFLDGYPAQHSFVKKCWAEYQVGLTFEYVGHEGRGSSDVRITFEGEGFHSLVGNTRQVSKDEPTMKLGAKIWDGNRELRAHILHEGLHMLGFGHEHASPKSRIKWNINKAFKHFKTLYGWDRKKTHVNVLTQYPADQVDASEYDPKSIMHYQIEDSCTQDGFCVLVNLELSNLDKQKLKSMYAENSHIGVAEASPPTLPMASASPPPPTLATVFQLVGGQAKLVGLYSPLVLLLAFVAARVCKLV